MASRNMNFNGIVRMFGLPQPLPQPLTDYLAGAFRTGSGSPPQR